MVRQLITCGQCSGHTVGYLQQAAIFLLCDQPSVNRKDLKMKVHVLTAAVLAALASRAVLAASEGGDTWSALEPIQQSTYSVLQSAPRVESPEPALDAAFEGSEGGDTWSSLQALRETTVQQASIQDHRGQADTEYAGPVGGSEGGDTWSSLVPQLQGQPMGSSGLASAPRIEQR
jgi:hypothetical protein